MKSALRREVLPAKEVSERVDSLFYLHMTYLLSRRAAFLSSFAATLLVVAMLAVCAPAYADNGNATSTDGAPGANAGQVIATSSNGTGGKHDVGGAIVTGDATATTSAQNNVNLNDVGNADSPCTPRDVDQNGGCLTSSAYTATSSNDALVGNIASSTASTGANTADGGQGLATVVTGNAFAFANVINLINTNIFNSQGLLLFLNQIFSTGLDLRDFNLNYFFDGQAGNSPTVNKDTGQPQCTLLTCPTSSAINVLSGNTATVTNSVIVRADAGGNTASTTDTGDASIGTGNAYAAANVVNLVNTNIVNSSYLLASFNNFGDLDGDITLPGDDFFSKLFAHGGSAPDMNSSSYAVNNTNQLGLTGTTTTNADTGANTASTTGTGSGLVTTGNAYSKSNTYTDANKNYVGGTSAFFMFRVAGEWTGNVKSLPDGLHFKRMYDAVDHNGIFSTSTLVLVTNENTDKESVPVGDPNGLQNPEGAPGANCTPPQDQNLQPGEAPVPVNNCSNSSSFLASSTNAAAVDNNVDVAANTGHNMAFTKDGDAHVISGDAYAIANVVNLINTNIVGRNWIFALFNVLGNWNGNISFGRSSLQLDAKTTAASVLPGADVTYSFTITNNGDRDADDITLKADFDHSLLSFTDSEGVPTDSGRQWHIPTVRRGQSQTFTYTAHVGSSIPSGTARTIPVAASVLSDGSGANAQASFTLATLNVVSPPSSGGGGGGGRSSSPKTVNKSADALPVPASSSKEPSVTVDKTVVRVGTTTPTTVDYKVVVTNAKDAGPLYGAKLADTLFNPDGSIMYNRSWDLQDLASGDQITLTYSVEFSTTTAIAAGTYRNIASVTGEKFKLGSGQAMLPALGEGTVSFGTGGMVLGAATDCSLAVNQALNYGMRNPEVIKLQSFLNAQQGSGLPVTGFFGPMTRAAVSAFQTAFSSDILAPLGLAHPTGTVGGMTMRKIRDLACTDSAAASSTPAL